MKRRLLIITNDGGREDYLAGVNVDKGNYIRFFRSPEGGSWEGDEMLVPQTDSFTTNSFREYIRILNNNEHIDYWLIVFCGHGGIYNNHETFFDFYNNDLIGEFEIRELLSDSRCLLIADSCRVLPVMESGGQMEQRLFSSRIKDNRYKNQSKAIYNQKIMEIPRGSFFRGYAASLYQGAQEIPFGLGGRYSYNLLLSAQREIQILKLLHLKKRNMVEQVLSFSYIHAKTRDRVRSETGGQQIPVYYTARINQPPFCVVPNYSL